MFNLENLKKFIKEANMAGYASGNDNSFRDEEDKSKTIMYERENWKFHDNYFGGEPYGGREVVFYDNKPVFMMVYYGRISDENIDRKIVYPFLQNSLKLFNDEYPFRGPERYEENIDGKKLEYTNNWNGEIDYFDGIEKILVDGKEVYEARYCGGLVDR